MNAYQTIFGERVVFSPLDTGELGAIQDLIEASEELLANKADHSRLWAEFLRRARKEVLRRFRSAVRRREVLQGEVGVVLRDCTYRLILSSVSSEGLEAAVQRLWHFPGRVLFDAFILSFGTQAEFAERSTLDSSVVSTIFKYLKSESDSSPKLSLQQFEKACGSLGVAPRLSFLPEGARAEDVDCSAGLMDVPVGATGRERQLRILAATVATLLLRRVPKREVLRVAGLNLSELYGVSDALALDRIVSSFVADVELTLSGETSEVAVRIPADCKEALAKLNGVTPYKVDEESESHISTYRRWLRRQPGPEPEHVRRSRRRFPVNGGRVTRREVSYE